MRNQEMNWICAFFVVGFALGCGIPSGRAAEDRVVAQARDEGSTPEQEGPAAFYETEGDIYLGYRWLTNEDSLKAAEHINPHSSLTFGLDLLSCPLPYRYHVNTEFLSNHDFYADAGFAYQDLILYRDILVGSHQNFNHYSYQNAGEAGLNYSDRDAGEAYDTDFVNNLSALRIKAPDFPFHTFINHRHVEQDAMVQQRFLLGTFGQLNKVSESRDLDWNSDALKLGANSHAGPVEVEYAYDLAKFDPEGQGVLYDTYPGSAARTADVYPHNVVAETESSANSLKLHSSYTGAVVAAATLSNLNQQNNYSGTQSDAWKQAFDFSWIPDPVVGLFFKYRHRNEAVDTPDTVTFSGLGNTLNYSVREGVSYAKDVFSLSSRYRPSRILALFATYEFSHLEREDYEEWVVLPGETDIHSINFTAHATPLELVKVKASYEYKNYSQPAYNNTPDNSNKLRLTTTYTPTPAINIELEYILSLTERDTLRYLNTPSLLLDAGGRDGRSDQVLASLAMELSATMSLTASWFYQRWDVEQDLAYGQWVGGVGGLPYIDAGVPYADESNSFSLGLFCTPREDITMGAGLTYIISEGTYGYDDMVGGAPFSLASFSALKASETIFSLEGTKKLSKEWEVGLKSYLGIYVDRAYGFLDGNIFAATCNFKRYF